MSSWFDQIDLSALDLAGLQDQLVKSVEEASELIDNVGKLEILNFDELAVQQEEEEAEESNEKAHEDVEIIVHHYDMPELQDQEVAVQNDTASGTTIIMQASAQDQLVSLPKKVTRKNRKTKSKKKTLDFFGTSYEPTHEEHETPIKSHHNEMKSSSSSRQSMNIFDNDVGFALVSSLFDHDEQHQSTHGSEHGSDSRQISYTGYSGYKEENMGSTDGDRDSLSDTHNNINHSSATHVEQQTTSSSSSNYFSNLFSSHIRIPLQSVQTSFSFFDDLDNDTTLEQDPILLQVEINKSLPPGSILTPVKPAYVTYLESVMPRSLRKIDFNDPESGLSPQQLTDQLLNSDSSNSGGSRLVLDTQTDTAATMATWQILKTSIQTHGTAFYAVETDLLTAVSISLIALWQSELSWQNKSWIVLVMIWNILKMMWFVIVLFARILGAICWCSGLLTFTLIVRRLANRGVGAENMSTDEMVNYWRQRWQSLSNEYCTTNNVVVFCTGLLFVLSYYRFQRYGTDAGDR